MAITKWPRSENVCKNEIVRTFGPIPKNQCMDLTCGCRLNTTHAYITRTVVPTIYPNQPELLNLIEFAKEYAAGFYPKFKEYDVAPYEIEAAQEYILNSKHTAGTKEVHLAALEQAEMSRKIFNRTNIFTKKEVLASGPREGRIIAARVTTVRDLQARGVDMVKDVLGEQESWVKGLQPHEVVQLLAEKFADKPVVFGCDYSMFDKSQSHGMLAVEMAFVERAFSPSFAKFYDACLRSPIEAVVDYNTRIISQVQRNSGDSDTALGNTIINQVLIEYTLWKQSKMPMKEWIACRASRDLMVEGDDSLFTAKNLDFQAFVDTLDAVGIKTTCEVFKDGASSFLKIDMVTLADETVPSKVPIQQLARLFVDPKCNYEFHSQKAQMGIQCSIACMIDQYGRPPSLFKLLRAVQNKTAEGGKPPRVYINPDTLEASPHLDAKWLQTRGLFCEDGLVKRRYARYSAINSLNMGAFFEAKYGILVDTIIDALEKGEPTYMIPEELEDEIVTDGKRLPNPKLTRYHDTLQANELIRGPQSPAGEERNSDEEEYERLLLEGRYIFDTRRKAMNFQQVFDAVV